MIYRGVKHIPLTLQFLTYLRPEPRGAKPDGRLLNVCDLEPEGNAAGGLLHKTKRFFSLAR